MLVQEILVKCFVFGSGTGQTTKFLEAVPLLLDAHENLNDFRTFLLRLLNVTF